MIEATIGRLAGGHDLTQEEMAQAVRDIMSGQCQDQEIGLFLTGLRMKGESVAEIAGAALVLREHMRPIRSSRSGLLDTCGTGGDRSGTFNISTAAALVTAACGVPVAKHGNRSASGNSSSADVLEHLGVNIQPDVERVEACLEELGICFCFAPLFHPSMKQVASVRRQLGVPTIFNLLGPLANPAGAQYQLLGVGFPAYRAMMAEALVILGTGRALVVCGEDGLDEVTLTGPTAVSQVGSGPPREFTWEPSQFGIEAGPLEPLIVSGPAESAALIQKVLSGEPGPARDIVLLNAGAALWTAEFSPDPAECAARAAEAIDSGAASAVLARLVEFTQG